MPLSEEDSESMSGATPNPRQEEAAGLSAAPPPYSVCIVSEVYFEGMEFLLMKLRKGERDLYS